MEALTSTVATLAQTVAQMASLQASAQASGGDKHTKLVEALIEVSRESAYRPRGDRPKLEASSAEGLRGELRKLKSYFNESKIGDRKTWFKVVRGLAEGVAATELEYFIAKEFGGEDSYQRALLEDDKSAWAKRWTSYESRLKAAAHLDDEGELAQAVKAYGAVRLDPRAGVKDAAAFLEEYVGARAGMLEQGLLDDSNPRTVMREIQDFKDKVAGSAMLTFLMRLPGFPSKMEADDASQSKDTVLGRCRQFLKAELPSGTEDGKAEGSLLVADANSRIPGEGRKGNPGAVADAIATILALGGDRPKSTSKGVDDKGKGRGKGKSDVAPGLGDCPVCKGTHPECSTCPNEAAAAEEGFDEVKAAQGMVPCWYRHSHGQGMCTGVGHFVRHHVASLTPAAFQEMQESKKKHEADKKARQGDGAQGAQRLDMSESHDDTPQQRAAERLLAALS